jgi:hypothetical protein
MKNSFINFISKVTCNLTVPFFCSFFLISGCEKAELPPVQLQNPTNLSVNSRISIVANNYTGDVWRNGISVKEDSQGAFYFLVSSMEKNSIKVGDQLNFKKTGVVKVLRIDFAKQNDLFAVFVTVDRRLDPLLDGFPNSIDIL